MANFVIVIDGEAVGNLSIPDPSEDWNDEKNNAFERMNAALASDPKLIKYERVQEGSIWDGQNFIPPVE